MPTKPRREDALIKLFLSAYENDTWAGCRIRWLDQEQDGAVEVLATRSDGRTLAIEHTLIESFIGEREDFERFRVFLRIEEDESLSVRGQIIHVNVPRGVLKKGHPWNHVADAVHDWLRTNVLPPGPSMQTCWVAALGAAPATEVILEVDVKVVAGFAGRPPLVRRYGPVNLDETVEKALKEKLPKLVGTGEDKRILLLERNQWTLGELDIYDEIEKRREAFPALAKLDEVWFAETVFYDIAVSDAFRGYADFKHYVNRTLAENIASNHGKLFARSKNGIPLPTHETL